MKKLVITGFLSGALLFSQLSNAASLSDLYQKFGDRSYLTDIQKEDQWRGYKNNIVDWEGTLLLVDRCPDGKDCYVAGFRHGNINVIAQYPSRCLDYLKRWYVGGKYRYSMRLWNYKVGNRFAITGKGICDPRP